MLNNASEYAWMARAEGNLWWYRVLHALVADALARHPKDRQARVLDAGCGTGGLMRFLAGCGYENVSGFDLSPVAVEICRTRGLNARQGDLREISGGAGLWDAIVSNDTLYFFDPPVQERILQSFSDLLAPAGLLILNLPALRCFRGRHDQAVGITNRFSPADVQRLLPCAGFEILHMRFWPFLLSPFVYAVRYAQRLRMAIGPEERRPRADTRLPPRWLNEVLAHITHVEVSWFPSAPFGSSLFVVAKKSVT